MSPKEDRDTHDDYMYKFRTKLCTKKRCRNPPKCFDAHSEVMRRRVPRLGKDGLFNYIPAACPQWQKSKKCSWGESCLRSHGWLEIIFHPLLYKTKMCKSNLRNGICRGYGVYCAKAHNPVDIRNLLDIYGWDWKRHYDLSLRDNGSSSIMNSQKNYCKKAEATTSKRKSAGKIFDESFPDPVKRNCPEQTQARGSTKTTPTLRSFKPCIDSTSPLYFTSPPLFGDSLNICDCISELTLDGGDGGVTSYTQLYSEDVTMDEVDDGALGYYTKSPNPKARSDGTLQSSGMDVPPQESPSGSSSFSNFVSSFEENWKKGDSMDAFWNFDAKLPMLDKEFQSSSSYEENSESLFALPPYESNWNKNFIGSSLEII